MITLEVISKSSGKSCQVDVIKKTTLLNLMWLLDLETFKMPRLHGRNNLVAKLICFFKYIFILKNIVENNTFARVLWYICDTLMVEE